MSSRAKLMKQILDHLTDAANANLPAMSREEMRGGLIAGPRLIQMAMRELCESGAVTVEGSQYQSRYRLADGRVTAWRFAARRRPATVTRGKVKPCITCAAAFLSAGAHNRMCDDCRATLSADAAPAFSCFHNGRPFAGAV